MNIKHYAAAGYPALAIATADEDRAIGNVLAAFPDKRVLKINALNIVYDVRPNKLGEIKPVESVAGYPAAFAYAGRNNGNDWLGPRLHELRLFIDGLPFTATSTPAQSLADVINADSIRLER